MNNDAPQVAVACPGCRHVGEGTFCNACGEHLYPERASLKNIAQSLLDALFDIDSGLFYTLRRLLLNPAKTIRNFFDGDRSRHMNPLKFLMFISYRVYTNM